MAYRPMGCKRDLLSLIVLTGRWSVTGFWVRCQQWDNAHAKAAHLDNFEQFFRTVDAANGELMEELD